MARATRKPETEPPPSEVSVSVGKGVRLKEPETNELADFAAEACDAILSANGNRRRRRAPSRVDVVIGSNGEIQRLNRDFRGDDKPTDVISFPVPGANRAAIEGDIAISAAIAASNARRLGHPVVDELKILILHGMLHLAGYDHESDKGAMAKLEAQLRGELQLPGSLIQRASSANPGAQKRRRRSAR